MDMEVLGTANDTQVHFLPGIHWAFAVPLSKVSTAMMDRKLFFMIIFFIKLAPQASEGIVIKRRLIVKSCKKTHELLPYPIFCPIYKIAC